MIATTIESTQVIDWDLTIVIGAVVIIALSLVGWAYSRNLEKQRVETEWGERHKQPVKDVDMNPVFTTDRSGKAPKIRVQDGPGNPPTQIAPNLEAMRAKSFATLARPDTDRSGPPVAPRRVPQRPLPRPRPPVIPRPKSNVGPDRDRILTALASVPLTRNELQQRTGLTVGQLIVELNMLLAITGEIEVEAIIAHQTVYRLTGT